MTGAGTGATDHNRDSNRGYEPAVRGGHACILTGQNAHRTGPLFDLEDERPAKARGFDSLRSRSLTSEDAGQTVRARPGCPD